MSERDEEAAPRRHGAAQRPAGARPDALGRGGAPRRRHDRGRLRRASRTSTARSTDVPGVRGVIRLGEAMAVIPLVKRALPEARLPWQDASVAGAVAAAAIGGSLLRRRLKGPGGEAAIAALSVLPSLVALRGGDLAAYHGVEHKAIGAYEQDADARAATKEHDRCGSHLMAPMLAANLAGAALLRRVLDAALAGGERGDAARVARRRGRGVRLVRAPRADRDGARAAAAGARAAARARDARADRRAARGRARGARRDPARRGLGAYESGGGPAGLRAQSGV